MTYSRRSFMKWAAAVSTVAVAGPGRTDLVPPFGAGLGRDFQPNLLPSQKEVWDQQLWMVKLGPKYTGNKAHTTFVEFLATQFKSAGCEVAREHYTLPRWEARRWDLNIAPASGQGFKAPVTSYFPYSGQTSAGGVTASSSTPAAVRRSRSRVCKGRWS